MRHAFHVRAIALYFAALLLWRLVDSIAAGQHAVSAAVEATPLLLLAASATGMLAGLAWLASRAAVYTITTHRVIMRIGIALPITINIPFRMIESAAVKVFADGAGDIPLRIAPSDRIAFLLLWPHCRPWQVSRPQPMLRGIPAAAEVARTLSSALASFAEPPAAAISRQPLGEAGAAPLSPAAA
jgi:hypothetical protein